MIVFTIPNICGTIVLITVAPADNTKVGLMIAFYAMKVFQSVSRHVLAVRCERS